MTTVNIEQLSKEELINLIRKSEAEMVDLENKLAILERTRSFMPNKPHLPKNYSSESLEDLNEP